MEKTLRVTCNTLSVPYGELHGIQGALRTMSKENFSRLRKLIVKDGINFALHVWKQLEQTEDGQKLIRWWIIDGHGRHGVIKYLVEEEGYTCPPLPCVEIEAVSFEDAKRRVLAAASNYNSTTKEGLYEFMSGLGIGIEEMENYNLVDIDLPDFKMEFFDDPAAEADEATEEAPTRVEFDAYKNAAVKQVTLYFAAEDYQKVVSKLDQLMTEYGLEDFSQVVWRLLSEKNSAE
jgi:hypothetical protein